MISLLIVFPMRNPQSIFYDVLFVMAMRIGTLMIMSITQSLYYSPLYMHAGFKYMYYTPLIIDSAIDLRTRVWIEYMTGEVVTSIKLIPNITMDSLVCKSDGAKVTFSIEGKLPTGLNMGSLSGLISGMPTKELQPTVFTITATNSSGSASMIVTLTIAKCEYEDLLYPVFSFSAEGRLILSSAGHSAPIASI